MLYYTRYSTCTGTSARTTSALRKSTGTRTTIDLDLQLLYSVQVLPCTLLEMYLVLGTSRTASIGSTMYYLYYLYSTSTLLFFDTQCILWYTSTIQRSLYTTCKHLAIKVQVFLAPRRGSSQQNVKKSILTKLNYEIRLQV